MESGPFSAEWSKRGPRNGEETSKGRKVSRRSRTRPEEGRRRGTTSTSSADNDDDDDHVVVPFGFGRQSRGLSRFIHHQMGVSKKTVPWTSKFVTTVLQENERRSDVTFLVQTFWTPPDCFEDNCGTTYYYSRSQQHHDSLTPDDLAD